MEANRLESVCRGPELRSQIGHCVRIADTCGAPRKHAIYLTVLVPTTFLRKPVDLLIEGLSKGRLQKHLIAPGGVLASMLRHGYSLAIMLPSKQNK
jgi:hypothetical protein